MSSQLRAPGRFTAQGNSTYYPLDRRLRGFKTQSGRGGEKKDSQPLSGLEHSIIQPVAQLYNIELFRLINTI
jgi:hypothetical protein